MYKRVMSPILDAFKQKKAIYIYKSEKANGENFQISYNPELKAWIIGSKNVSILAANKEDLNFYK
jgi:hypothetical protein